MPDVVVNANESCIEVVPEFTVDDADVAKGDVLFIPEGSKSAAVDEEDAVKVVAGTAIAVEA